MTQLISSNVLSSAELKVYLNELNSPKLCWLTDIELHDFMADLLSEISIMTGAKAYEYDWQNSMLITVIIKLLKKDDAIMALTTNEVSDAFYLNHNGAYPHTHSTYNKEINADYVGNIIRDYRYYKLRSLEKEWAINKILNPPPEKPIPVYTTADYKKFIQMDYELYKTGNTDYIFNIEKKYILLRRAKIIIYPSPLSDAWKKWYQVALKKREWNTYTTKPVGEAERLTKRKAMEMYHLIKTANIVPQDEHISVVSMLHKLVYFRFFELMKEQKIERIFEEISHTTYDPVFNTMVFIKFGT